MTGESRLRVLQVGKFYPPHMGGMEMHLQTLCRQLRPSVDQEVLVAGDSLRTTRDEPDGVSVERLGTWSTVASAPLTPGLTRRLRRTRADIVHVHLPHPTAILAYLTSRRRGALIATYHSDIVRQRLLGRLFAPLQHRFLGACRWVFATSPNYLATSPVLDRHRARCRVIPYGVPLAEFERADVAQVAALRARYGDRLVLAVGRLIYYKGFDILIRAMRAVDGHLLLIGDGPLRASLARLAAEADVAAKITFLGELNNRDVAPYYHAAAVFALPSVARSEAFGIVQIEAMASGTPVVNTALDSGVPYVSLDGVTGLTVAPSDPAALAAALERLLDDADLRSRLGQNGRQRARDEFSDEVMARRILDAYRECAPTHRETA